MEYLKKEDIVFINQKTVERHGGNFVPPLNFLNEAPLDYLIEAVETEMFGESLYPEIYHKAGLYMFNIISNHVFQDGNKRTGLESALIFLRLNGYRLKTKIESVILDSGKKIPMKGESTSEILIEFTLELAGGKLDLEESQKWFERNIVREGK